MRAMHASPLQVLALLRHGLRARVGPEPARRLVRVQDLQRGRVLLQRGPPAWNGRGKRLQSSQKLKATLANPTIRRFLIHYFEL